MSRWKRPPKENYPAILMRMLAMRGATAADLTRLTKGEVLPQTTSKILSGAVKVPMLSTWRSICAALACTVDGVPLEEVSTTAPRRGTRMMKVDGEWRPLSLSEALRLEPGTVLNLKGPGVDGCAMTVEQAGKEKPKWVTFALFAPLPDRLHALRKAEGPLFSGAWRRGSRVRRTVAYLLGHWGPPETHQEGRRTVKRRRYVHGPAYGPHAFRHTLTSRLVDAGASLHEVQEAMGHDSIKTTLLYYHRRDSAPVLRMRDRLENDLTPSS